MAKDHQPHPLLLAQSKFFERKEGLLREKDMWFSSCKEKEMELMRNQEVESTYIDTESEGKWEH